MLGGPEHSLDVLDLGCGTGLCAPIFKPWSKSLVGVDLSSKMVAKAEERGLYDQIIIADLLEPLSSGEECLDLILAADVFIYVGKLDAVFAGCSRSLRKDGILAFSIEVIEEGGADYILHGAGRYAQSRNYIETLAASSSFTVHTARDTVLRKERGEAAKGVIYVLVKQG